MKSQLRSHSQDPWMWTPETPGRYDRSKLRYPSDLTEDEWSLIAPLIPPAKRGGNKRTVDVREVVNGIMYVLSTSCEWAAVPKDLPAPRTIRRYLLRWDDDRTLDRLHDALCVQCREQAERKGGPTIATINSPSVKSANQRDSRTRSETRHGRHSRVQGARSWLNHRTF